MICDDLKETIAHSKLHTPAEVKMLAELDAKIDKAQRLILDNEVAAACAYVVMSNPISVADATKVLRCPYDSLWVEWAESARHDILEPLHSQTRDDPRDKPKRLGFLIEASKDGRAGVITFAWTHFNGQTISAALEFHFDLDSVPDRKKYFAHYFEGLTIWKVLGKSKEQQDAILDLYGQTNIVMRPAGKEMLKFIGEMVGKGRGPAQIKEAMQYTYESWLGDVFGEYFSALAVLIMLTAKHATERKQVDNTKLTKARQKKGKTPLHNYDTVHMYLHKRERGTEYTRSQTRNGVRLHVVRGHYVTRGQLIYWRRPHMRGGTGHGTPANPKRIVHA